MHFGEQTALGISAESGFRDKACLGVTPMTAKGSEKVIFLRHECWSRGTRLSPQNMLPAESKMIQPDSLIKFAAFAVLG